MGLRHKKTDVHKKGYFFLLGSISLILVPCLAGCKESCLIQVFVISLQHLSGNGEPAFSDFEWLTLLWAILVCLQSDKRVALKTTRRTQSLRCLERSKREVASLSTTSLCEPQDHCWSLYAPSDDQKSVSMPSIKFPIESHHATGNAHYGPTS